SLSSRGPRDDGTSILQNNRERRRKFRCVRRSKLGRSRGKDCGGEAGSRRANAEGSSGAARDRATQPCREVEAGTFRAVFGGTRCFGASGMVTEILRLR